MIRSGIGYDAHRLVPGRPLILGGVELSHTHGLEGHSDADVLCHAIADALLGAAGLPDIGHYFPPGDERWRGMSSLAILGRVRAELEKFSARINNIDTSLLAEQPKILPHAPLMKERIAASLGIDPRQVGIKATTNEGLGFAGRGEGMCALAIATLEIPDQP
ncbi:MAG: 2-C-methyl-D-erythritol 2,4-cyclodiphosphate synthase [Verrucomicrobiales bacterium]